MDYLLIFTWLAFSMALTYTLDWLNQLTVMISNAMLKSNHEIKAFYVVRPSLFWGLFAYLISIG